MSIKYREKGWVIAIFTVGIIAELIILYWLNIWVNQ